MRPIADIAPITLVGDTAFCGTFIRQKSLLALALSLSKAI